MTREEAVAVATERGHWEPNTGCLLWPGATDGAKGYAIVTRGNRHVRLTRAILGICDSRTLQACHRCDQPACVNPDHLFVGTNQDNQWDSATKGRNSVFKASGLHEIVFPDPCPKCGGPRIWASNGRRAGKRTRKCPACHRARCHAAYAVRVGHRAA